MTFIVAFTRIGLGPGRYAGSAQLGMKFPHQIAWEAKRPRTQSWSSMLSPCIRSNRVAWTVTRLLQIVHCLAQLMPLSLSTFVHSLSCTLWSSSSGLSLTLSDLFLFPGLLTQQQQYHGDIAKLTLLALVHVSYEASACESERAPIMA
jgi:hypothetical protein